jgi:hypothetical protein
MSEEAPSPAANSDEPPEGPPNFIVSTKVKLPQAHWDFVNGKVKLTPRL